MVPAPSRVRVVDKDAEGIVLRRNRLVVGTVPRLEPEAACAVAIIRESPTGRATTSLFGSFEGHSHRHLYALRLINELPVGTVEGPIGLDDLHDERRSGCNGVRRLAYSGSLSSPRSRSDRPFGTPLRPLRSDDRSCRTRSPESSLHRLRLPRLHCQSPGRQPGVDGFPGCKRLRRRSRRRRAHRRRRARGRRRRIRDVRLRVVVRARPEQTRRQQSGERPTRADHVVHPREKRTLT